jgi:cyclohexanone monooxygenase
LCADTDYFETYNKSNVDLIDINKTPIESLTTNGLKTSKDQFSFDIIIFATGFDAMTGALTSIDIIGKNGVNLADKWKEGPRSYLGLCIEGFPNMFTITGPGSPSVLGNMMVAIEQHVEWIIDCIKHMNANDKKEIEAEFTAENEWMDLVEIIASSTLRDTCNSWYVGANVPGKKRVFMPYAGGYQTYREKCDEIAKTNYEGFKIS